jgi:hypothetical protein
MNRTVICGASFGKKGYWMLERRNRQVGFHYEREDGETGMIDSFRARYPTRMVLRAVEQMRETGRGRVQGSTPVPSVLELTAAGAGRVRADFDYSHGGGIHNLTGYMQ